jgi:hypothetical protein
MLDELDQTEGAFIPHADRVINEWRLDSLGCEVIRQKLRV